MRLAERGDALARHSVPDLDGAVAGGADVPLAVEGPLHAGHSVSVLKTKKVRSEVTKAS